MIKIDFQDFYHEWPMKNPIPVEKYFMDNGSMLDTRQMTYSFTDMDGEGLEPTFEVDDVVYRIGVKDAHVIIKNERIANEIYIQKLDEKMKPMMSFVHVEDSEIYHKLKDVEWINRT